MHCILLVLLHGANGNPQELDIFTKSELLQQVGIAVQCIKYASSIFWSIAT